MLLTESELKLIIKEYLLENKIPEKGKKMYDSVYYQSKDGKAMGMTLVYQKAGVAYFLLPKGSKLNGANSFRTVNMPRKGESHLNWSADLDDYSDYNQTTFFKHIKMKRVVSGTDFKKQEDYSEHPVEEFFYNFGYDAVASFAGALELLPIPGIQQAAMVISKGMSTGAFVSAVRQNEFVSASFALIGMLPVVGGSVGSALKNAEKARKAKVLPKVILAELKKAFRKFLESDVQYMATLTLDKLLQGSGLSSDTILPKINGAVKSYVKVLDDEEKKA